MSEVLWRSVLETRLGPMTAIASPAGLCALEFQNRDRLSRLEARLRRWFTPLEIREGMIGTLTTVQTWLGEYFSGLVTQAGPTPLDLRGTDFEQRVWNCLLQVQAGTTFTYSEVAARLGRTSSARAVGTAVGSNPVSIIVPCHRIVGIGGHLTGYGGGLDRKRWLLNHEAEHAGKPLGRLF